MKKEKRVSLFAIIICGILLISIFYFRPISAGADMAPKPSIKIIFENLSESNCYGTLLSKYDSSGPAIAWDGDEERAYYKEKYDHASLRYDVWKAFVDYVDSDGYYFLQTGWDVGHTKEIDWTYYPPKYFKILLYFPDTGEFAVSDINSRYAFDSYFTVDMEGLKIGEIVQSENIKLDVKKSYDYTWEIFSLLVRIILTVLLEIGIAFIFGYRGKKQLLFIFEVNVITQVLLNVILNIINYLEGVLVFFIFFIILEFIVFLTEAVLYFIFLKRDDIGIKSRLFPILYAFIANAVSFGAGFAVAYFIPGIF